MSPSIPSTTVNRREAIRRTALILGGALSASSIAAVLAGCETKHVRADSWTPRALSNDQAEFVATIAEHILPQTDTPGARAAGVHTFIDALLADYQLPEERKAFLRGLDDVDARAERDHGRAFLRCDTAQQRATLEAMDREAFPPRSVTAGQRATDESRETERGGGGTPAVPSGTKASHPSGPNLRRRSRLSASGQQPFMRTMKELTLLGYYTSKVGATQELRYTRVPGRFEGCVPFALTDRAWSV